MKTILCKMVELNRELSNQIFSVLEEWKRILQEFDGDIFMDFPEPEF